MQLSVGSACEGTFAGTRARRSMYQITSHDAADERHGVQGTGWQKGVPAACAGIMLAKGIDPAPFLDLMTAHGTPWSVIDLAPDEELPI